jgi:hypothetical protein
MAAKRKSSNWGGARPGAGRKPGPGGPKLRHGARPNIQRETPVHLTLSLARGVPTLRSQAVLDAFKRSMLRASSAKVRFVHYSLQRDRIHLIIEALNQDSLGRALGGLASRFNTIHGTRGDVFADRYRRRDLKSPREVRDALVVVLQSGTRPGRPPRLDEYSSAAFFDGWSPDANGELERLRASLPADEPAPVAEARFWLLAKGWKRYGTISVNERPGEGSEARRQRS